MRILFISLVLAATVFGYEDEPLAYGNFPDGFVWGVATSAYQIEGGWDEGGKGLSIWDVFTTDWDSNGKVACDSYHKYKEDVQLIVNLNVTHYRFSIAWTRIFPDGVGETVNEKGILYYNNLIDELKRNNIEPVVTLYHWDLPHALEEQGGWLNADIAVWFEEYARACFVNFGDRVKFWITLNEPYVVAHLGYGIGIFAPGISGSGTSEYIAAHNLLRAHAKAYRLYEREFKNQQGGIIGITLDAGWPIPEDDSQPNIDAAERNIQFDLGWFANPIFSENGDYPQIMKEKIAEKSQLQGYEKSRLPEFTQQEIIELKGSSDFFGHNFYRGFMVADFQSDIGSISQDADKDTFVYADPTWYTTGSSWLNVTPFAMRSILNWIKTTYNNPKIYITENGVSDKAGNLDDFGRVYWYKHYINNVLKATMDGADVKGYFAWSLMDNFEWNAGYTEKFGLHSVNFTDPVLPRRPKKSTELFSAIVRSNGFIEGLIPCE